MAGQVFLATQRQGAEPFARQPHVGVAIPETAFAGAVGEIDGGFEVEDRAHAAAEVFLALESQTAGACATAAQTVVFNEAGTGLTAPVLVVQMTRPGVRDTVQGKGRAARIGVACRGCPAQGQHRCRALRHAWPRAANRGGMIAQRRSIFHGASFLLGLRKTSEHPAQPGPRRRRVMRRGVHR